MTRILAREGRTGDIYRANGYAHGVGVAVDGDAVYVVYRTCNLGY